MSSRRPSLPALLAAAHPAIGALLGVALIAGCGGASRQAGPAPRPGPPPIAAAPVGAAQSPKDKEAASASRPATSGPGVITRAELRRVIEKGAQEFIQLMHLRPAFGPGGRFSGWRIIAYRGPGPVQVGDVVQRVNGRALERPHQFMEAWNSVSRGSELVVEMVRGGRRLVLRWAIVD